MGAAAEPMRNAAGQLVVPAPPEIPRALHKRIARVTRFIIANRLYTPRYVVHYLRYLKFRLLNPHIECDGFFFMARGVEIYARRGYARLSIGRWAFIGRGNAIRCHEGNLRIGNKVVMGATNTINCYLDIEIGDDCILADWIYICDFDHRYEDMSMPIKKQGIIKSPVKIGTDCWIGEKATILRGVSVGDGCVIASHALVNKDVPPNSIVGGVPARVIKKRGEGPQRT